jgi:hypothetical protein
MAKKTPGSNPASQPPNVSGSTQLRDPDPAVDRIDELARRILTGDILLPKFQRNFVWGKPQILKLLDSVAKGFPIGSILLWQSRQDLRSENQIADLSIGRPRPDYPVNYLLDGQQRLSVICGAMYWKGNEPGSRWNIAYDLRTRSFLHLDTLDDPPQHQVRMNKLSEPSVFFKHVSSLDTLSASDKDELKSRADELFNRFKDYKIATVTLGDMPIKDVAPIFERINSTGTQLTIVDLMRAATWSPDFDLIDIIEEMLDALRRKGFSKIDKKTVLRNISAAAGGGFSVESIDTLRKHDAQKLKAAAEETQEGYKRAVDFLSTQIGVAGASIVPYKSQLIILAEVFRRVPSPNADQYRAINEWFWRNAWSGYFGGWNTGQMATDLKAIQDFAVGTSKEIQFNSTRPGPDIWRVRTFRLNNAHARLLAIILSHHHPVDILTGQQVDATLALAWANAKEYHHFFPQKFLKTRKEKSHRINCLANIIMLSSASNKAISGRAPSSYLQDVEKAAGPNLLDWLGANLITKEAYEAARADDFDQFLQIRSATIHTAIAKKANWPAS